MSVLQQTLKGLALKEDAPKKIRSVKETIPKQRQFFVTFSAKKSLNCILLSPSPSSTTTTSEEVSESIRCLATRHQKCACDNVA